MKDQVFEAIEAVYRSNLEKRHMDRILLESSFEASVVSINDGQHIVLVTGFVVKDTETGETDGPPSTLHLAKALETIGKRITIVTDPVNAPLIQVGLSYLSLNAELLVMPMEGYEVQTHELLEDQSISHVIAIERPSQGADGEYYSMRGECITSYVANTDFLFHRANQMGLTTIAVGDGGNEIGMALVKEQIHRDVPLGSLICAQVPVKYLLIAGVSNWGAYGLIAGLSILRDDMLLPSKIEAVDLLRKLLEAGAVDGFSKKRVMMVDGFDMAKNNDVLSEMHAIIEDFRNA